MGLFDSLLNAIKASKGMSSAISAPTPAAADTTTSASMSSRGGKHPAARAIDIDGECKNTVFTYIGAPLKSVRKGTEFYVDPLGRDMVIHSKSTGATADSAEFGDAPVSYNGIAFGFTNSSLGFLKEMVAAGFTVRLKVKKTGMYSPGVPELVSMTAEPRLLKQWWERQKATESPIPFSETEEQELNEAKGKAKITATRQKRTGIELSEGSVEVWINVSDSNWVGGRPPRRDFRFTPTFETVPTPKGSSAKPHIKVATDGSPLVEISARSVEAYKQISANRKRPCRAIYMRDYYQDGTDQAKLYLVFD